MQDLDHICHSQGQRGTYGRPAARRQPADLLHAPILHFPQCKGDAPSSRPLHFNIYWHSRRQHHSKINSQIPIKNGKTEGGY